MKWLKNGPDFGIVCLVLVLIVLIFTIGLAFKQTQAASIPQYSYGMYIFGAKTHLWVEADEQEHDTIQGLLDKEDSPNIVSVFNLLGAVGWKYIGNDKQGGNLTLYIFERPVQ